MKIISNLLKFILVTSVVVVASCSSNSLPDYMLASRPDTTLYYNIKNGIKIDTINNLNTNHEKCGRWIECNNDQIVDTYYKHGSRDGKFLCLWKMSLYCIGEYELGKEVGTWLFYDNDTLKYICDNFQHGNFPMGTSKKFHSIFFYPNGTKKAEGGFYSEESIETDAIEYGIWHYYNTDGDLISEKDFGNGSDTIADRSETNSLD